MLWVDHSFRRVLPGVLVYKLKKIIEVTYDESGHCRKEDGLGRGEGKFSVSHEIGRPAA